MKAFVLLISVSMVGCAIPAAGTRCDSGVAYCSSSTAALGCTGGALLPYACSGPKGCTLGAGRAVLCDQSQGATAGAPCFPEYDGRGQCNAAGYLVCTKGAWAQFSCAAGTACHDDGGVACR